MALQVLGLTDDAERVYTALVRAPHSSSAQLAEVCELPSAAVGRLLSGLVMSGLATRSAGRPPRFTAAAPDTAVSKLISARERDLGTARELVHRLAEMYRDAARINDPASAVELLTSRDDVSAAARRMSAIAQHEVRALDRPPYVDRPGINLGEQLKRQKDGVAHRVVYDQTAVAWPGRLHGDINSSMHEGEQSRMHPELPLKLVIADRHTAIIPFSMAQGALSAAYLVHQSPLLVALECLFESYWEHALPIPDTVGQAEGTDQPDPETQMLLTMLAAGLSDLSIARAQGWSERTTQRRVRQLMQRLGAVTRFQTCLNAVRRGWL